MSQPHEFSLWCLPKDTEMIQHSAQEKKAVIQSEDYVDSRPMLWALAKLPVRNAKAQEHWTISMHVGRWTRL